MELPHAFWEVSASCRAEEEEELGSRLEDLFCEDGSWAPAVGCISHHEAMELLQLRQHSGVSSSPSSSAAPAPVMCTGVSLDLGKSEAAVWVTAQGISLEENAAMLVATWEELQEIVQRAEKGEFGCYALYTDGTKPWRISSVSLRTGRKASLHSMPNVRGPPTVILGNFPMHRLVGGSNSRMTIGPVEDTRRKLDALKMKRVYGRVFDTTTGLGYTAIAASKCKGVSEVITCEVDGSSLEMCRYNPWSSELFEDQSIRLVRGDVCEVVKTLPDHSFAAVIHDPPVMSLSKGSCVYGVPFYSELYRVLRWRGRLFHFVGNPSNKATRRLYTAIIQRLESVGFQKVTIINSAYGIVAEKGQDRKSSKRFLQQNNQKKDRRSRRRKKRGPFEGMNGYDDDLPPEDGTPGFFV